MKFKNADSCICSRTCLHAGRWLVYPLGTYFTSTKLLLQEGKKFTVRIIQEINGRNGRNNSLSVIKKHLSSPYPFKTNMQVWVHLAEHEFYKRQSRYSK